MPRLAADHHAVAAAAGQSFAQRRFRIEAFAALIERRHFQIGAEPDRAGVRRADAGQQVDQRGLAGAVRADDADPVAALNADRKVIDDGAAVIAAAHRLGFDHQFSGFVGLDGRHRGIADAAAIIAALAAQRVQIGEPLDVALAPAGHAIAQPMFLGDDLAIELVLFAFFLGEQIVAPLLEGGKAAVDLPHRAAIKPRRGARQIGQEAAVMADDHQRRLARGEVVFQPFDGGEIEMVGRLVEQQNVGIGRQNARQRRTPRFAARQMRGIFITMQAELFQKISGLVVVIARRQPGFDISERGRKAGKIRLLRQIAHRGARLHEPAAMVGLHQPGDDLQQRRFARAVAADQAEPIASGHGQFDAGEQRRAAKSQRDVFQLNQRRRHNGSGVAQVCG